MNDTNKNNLLTKNLKKLARLDTELGDVIKDLDNIKLRTREGGFSALLRAIVGQQSVSYTHLTLPTICSV